jgi:zinc protease
MFKGTDNLRPGDIDRITQRGAGHNNAYTSTDYTVFHFDFPADRWDAALGIEADRMRNLRIDAAHEFEQEKGSVVQELRMDEDEPWDLEEKALLPLLFGAGPYGHPVIGQAEHVRAATAAGIKAYYDRWYRPNNAVLVIAGGFDRAAAAARVAELFGPIAPADLPPRRPDLPVSRTEPARARIVSRFALPRMLMGFNTVRQGDPAEPALDVLSQILTGGKTGRLYRRLVEDRGLANEVASAHTTGRYPGYLSISVELLSGHDPQAAEQAVLDELRRLADEPVDAAELHRAQRSLIAGQIFDLEDVHDLADQIARTVAVTSLDGLRRYLPAVQAVTAAQVQQAARQYLDARQRAVVWSIPARPAAGDADTAPASGPVSGPARRAPHASADAGAFAAEEKLRQTRRVVLPNGLTLLLLENHRLPIVFAQAEVKGIRLGEPPEQAGVAELVGRLLAEGDGARTGAQIAEAIEAVGGALAFSADGGSVKVLADAQGLGLEVLLSCLTTPAFPADAVARERERLLSDLDDLEQQPESAARLAFAKLIYGAHPYGRSHLGLKDVVARLNAADCQTFHDRFYRPNNTVLAVVGDFDSARVIAQVQALTGAWTPAPPPTPLPPALSRPGPAQERYLTFPDAAQTHLYLGHLGVDRANPDYARLLVMDHIFGVGSGFTDRLSARIRDREGLAYSVYGGITGSADLQPGTFLCYAGLEPRHLAKVVRYMREEIERLRATQPGDAELADAKTYLTGSLEFRMGTDQDAAEQLLAVERYGLGFNYLGDLRRGIEAVTPHQVYEAARRYLDPDCLILVAAGAVDAQGRPLPAPPRP